MAAELERVHDPLDTARAQLCVAKGTLRLLSRVSLYTPHASIRDIARRALDRLREIPELTELPDTLDGYIEITVREDEQAGRRVFMHADKLRGLFAGELTGPRPQPVRIIPRPSPSEEHPRGGRISRLWKRIAQPRGDRP